MNRAFALGYFALQYARGGVRPEMVRRAGQILDRSRADLDSHVRTRLVALYGERAADPRWLCGQPLVERASLVEMMQRERKNTSLRKVERRRTSGSTGTPLHFVKDREMTRWMDAAMWAAYAWHGINPGSRQARFWGMPKVLIPRMKRRALDLLLHQRRLDAFRIGSDTSASFFRTMRRFRPEYAYGYPNLMRMFAEHCMEAELSGGELGLRVVVSTGELLTPETRLLLRRFFECPVINEYGCTESGLLALECESHKLHTIPIAAYTEVVDAATGSPRPPGVIGEAVVTDLYGEHVPLLRYRLHDRVRWSEQWACPCGRDLPIVQVDSGRIDSFIETPAHGPIYDAILAYTVPPGVSRFRAYQLAIDRLHAEITPGHGFDPIATPQECKRRWERELGPGVTVTIEVVSEIPFEASGKLQYFVPRGRDGEKTSPTPE